MFCNEYTWSKDSLHEAILQQENLKITRKLMTVMKGVCLVCLLAISALMFFGLKQTGVGFLFIAFALLLIFSRVADRHILGARLRKSPYWNHRIRIEIAEEGVRTTSDLGTGIMHWEAFTYAVGAKKGFILYLGPYEFVWLPLSTFLDSPDRGAVAALLRAKIKKYEERA